ARGRQGEVAPPRAADLTPPAWLSAYAQAYWQEQAPWLHQCGLLTVLDLRAFEGVCVLYARARELSEMVTRDGLTITNEEGYVKLNPALAHERKAWAEFRAASQEFGMSPRSRVGLPVAAEKESELDQF